MGVGKGQGVEILQCKLSDWDVREEDVQLCD